MPSAQNSTQKLSCLIGVEGGHSLDNSLSVLRSFYQLEMRYPMLTQICNTPWFPQGLEDVSTYPVLIEELLRRGWNEQELRGVLRGNLLQVFRHMEQVQEKEDGKVLWRKSFQRTSWTMPVTQSCHIATSETVSG
ncbi:hypothetical protein STEG23_014192 [Scotinomys teguina]